MCRGWEPAAGISTSPAPRSAPQRPSGFYWEAHASAPSAQPPTTIVVVLFPTPLNRGAFDQALLLRATFGAVAWTVRDLGAALGLATTPPWLVLDPNRPRIAI